MTADVPEIDIQMSSLTSLERCILSKALLGHDMSECTSPEVVDRIAKVTREVLSVDVMEMYSPERVAKLCKQYGLRAGCSLDLTNGFDFDLLADRQRAWEILERDRPLLVIGSPPCTYFSMLQELNKHLHKGDPAWLQRFDNNLQKAKRHVRFCCEMYEYQIANGKYFLHEHPWLARSWD